jgi:hypothetical protein
MSHIFISYSKLDIEFARRLREMLQAENFSVWMDETQLTSSEKWWPAIEQNIISCGAFIVIMSPNSKDSVWVEREILVAEDKEYQKPIFPILLSGKQWSRLANIQFEDMQERLEAKLSAKLISLLKNYCPQTNEQTTSSLSNQIRTKESTETLPNLESFFSKNIVPPPFKWVEIPAGKATFLDTREFVESFSIAKYPITTAQFQEFIREKGYSEKKWWDDEGWELKERLEWTQPDKQMWRGTKFYDDNRPLPVVGISWYEANAFCKWLSETSQEDIKLPSNLQWQRAAQGDDGRVYPWGNDWDSSSCNHNIDAKGIRCTSPVIQYEKLGASPFGVVDMLGNILEWCITLYEPSDTVEYILRGGSWYHNGLDQFEVNSRFNRFRDAPSSRKPYTGFRLARSL